MQLSKDCSTCKLSLTLGLNIQQSNMIRCHFFHSRYFFYHKRKILVKLFFHQKRKKKRKNEEGSYANGCQGLSAGFVPFP